MFTSWSFSPPERCAESAQETHSLAQILYSPGGAAVRPDRSFPQTQHLPAAAEQSQIHLPLFWLIHAPVDIIIYPSLALPLTQLTCRPALTCLGEKFKTFELSFS